jgi:hypothetical protein
MKRKDTPQRSLYLVTRSPLAPPCRPAAMLSPASCIPRLLLTSARYKAAANGAWHGMPRIKQSLRQRSPALLWFQSCSFITQALRAVAKPSPLTQAIGVWHEIYATLIPVIGHTGVCAVYQRSLRQARQTYPWLTESQDICEQHSNLQRLSADLALQNHFVAKAANSLLRDHFRDRLGRLLGQPLMHQLWHPDWGVSHAMPVDLMARNQSQPESNLYWINPLP